jgi:hypothetical protein
VTDRGYSHLEPDCGNCPQLLRSGVSRFPVPGHLLCVTITTVGKAVRTLGTGPNGNFYPHDWARIRKVSQVPVLPTASHTLVRGALPLQTNRQPLPCHIQHGLIKPARVSCPLGRVGWFFLHSRNHPLSAKAGPKPLASGLFLWVGPVKMGLVRVRGVLCQILHWCGIEP